MGRRGRDGLILVSVLGVMALLAALVGALAVMVRSTVEGARGGTADLVLHALVRGGIEIAGYQLHGLKVPAAQLDAQQVRLDAGIITLWAADESGRIDLNGADSALLAGLYRAAGLSALPSASFAARVADWRDEDDERSPGGAEAADYDAAGLGHRPQNDAFRAVDDLLWLHGVSPEHVAALRPLVTVHNPDGKLNVLSAGREALLTLPGLNPALVDRILAVRARTGTGAALMPLLQAQQAFVKAEPGPSYRVRVEARHRDRARTIEAVITPSRGSDALYYVVGWTDEDGR